MRFDWFGFIALAVGIGSLQLMLDRGEQLGWFDSTEIMVEVIISVAGFYFFFAHSLTTEKPFMRFEMFKDRNFVGACLFMVIIGVSLFGTMALVTPFLQNVLGYPMLTAGLLLGARGIGTLVAMMAVGRLIEVDRGAPSGGLRPRAHGLHAVRDDGVHRRHSSQPSSSRRDAGHRPRLRLRAAQHGGLRDAAGRICAPSGTAILTLMRNIGSSIGISIVIAELTSKTTLMHARLAEYVTPFNNALKRPERC